MMKSVSLVEETGVPGGNHRPTASNSWGRRRGGGGGRAKGISPMITSTKSTHECPIVPRHSVAKLYSAFMLSKV